MGILFLKKKLKEKKYNGSTKRRPTKRQSRGL